MRQKLMFPNKNRNDGESKEQDAQLEQENAKLREHIELLREEERLEKEKEKRAKKKKRRLTEAQVKKELRKKQAMAMRLRNIPIDVIAQRLEVSPGYVHGLIREAVQELPEETAEDMKKILTRTVVHLIGNFEQVANEGGVKEAEVLLKGVSHLMRLSGLNIQRRQVEQTNMEVGSISGGIDVADLNLDLETKKKLLQAIRDSEKLKSAVTEKPVTEDEEEDADFTDEEADTL